MAITVTMVTLFELNGRRTAFDVVRKKATNALLADQKARHGVFDNYNKNNNYNTRAVVALDEEEKLGWIDAYFDCIRNKLSAKQCGQYRISFEMDLWRLMCEVHDRTYKPSEAFCFIVTRPRIREIFAAAFRDRIAQHWVTLRIEPLLESRFKEQGDVSFNCRKGFGALRAIHTAQEHIERISENYTKDAWIGKIDIAGFFMSIDKNIMLDNLLPFIRNNYHGRDIDTLVWLTEVIVRHQPQLLCERRTPEWMWQQLPPHKSLFDQPSHIGMPIGNVTSQLLANYYLSFFDEFMMEQCAYHGAAFVRFVDDALIIANDKQFIIDLRLKAMQWLKKHLHLQLHQDKFYLQPATHGVKFVGCVIKPGRTYIANKTTAHLYERARQTDCLCRDVIENGATEKKLHLLRRYVNSLNSLLGFCIHHNAYNLRKRIFNDIPWFWTCCYMKKSMAAVRIRKKYLYESFIIKTNRHETSINDNARKNHRQKRRRAKHLHRGV